MPKFPVPENLYFGTKADYVIEALRTAVLLGDILPGERITEKQVRDALKVSSSPVREAFNQLVAEGLLTREPHFGTKVTSMDIRDAKELYSVQSHLQGLAVRICTKKLKEADILEAENINNKMKKMGGKRTDARGLRVENYKLHMVLCGANIYPWLTKVISGLWVLFPSQSLWLIPGRPQIVLAQHDEIIKALKDRDPILAGNLMTDHLRSSMEALYGDAGEEW
jgi:DNA-binding GntR family transcriptional regulator